MANKKKKKNNSNVPERTETDGLSTSDLYSLKSDAVDRLINASEDTAPEVSDAEIEALTGHKKFRIPVLVKVAFAKFWFAGAVCFFFIMGLGQYIPSKIDHLFVSGLAMGAVLDLLENNLFRFYEKSEGSSKKYMLVEFKQFWSIFLNCAYGVCLMLIIAYIYDLITLIIVATLGKDAAVTFGMEPLLFGIIAMLVDSIFIIIKNGIKKVFADAKKSAIASGN